MTIEISKFDIMIYAILLCAGSVLCYKVQRSGSFRQKSYEAMALDLLEQGKAQEAAHCVDRMQRWFFTKETHALAAIVYYKAGRIDQAKEHMAKICKPENMLFLYMASNATLKTLFDELKKHNE